MDLLTDPGIDDRSKLIGLLIERFAPPDGEPVEILHSQFANVLGGQPSSRTIGECIRRLIVAGYVEQKKGGGGRPNKFRAAAPVGSMATRPDAQIGSKTRPDATDGSHLSRRDTPGGSAVRRSRRVEEVDVDDVLETRAREVIDTEKLSGCRGALRDYLMARVPKARQYGYVQTLITWIDGGADASVFRISDGGQYQKSRTRLMAEALNELSGSDEGQMARPLGDVANLKTKINILIRSNERVGTNGGRDATKAGRNQKRSGGPDPNFVAPGKWGD